MKISAAIIFTALCLILSGTLTGQVIYVDINTSGNNNGTSWGNAYNNLHTALNNAEYGDSIWVAQGTYLTTLTNDRTIAFEIPNGVRLMGGFEGTETSIAQRDWPNHPTILSGDIAVPGDTTDNAYTVVYAFNSDASTLIDGFTIEYGNADDVQSSSSSPGKNGGGLFLIAQGPGRKNQLQVKNCIFKNNTALFEGGGLAAVSNNSSGVLPKVSHCTFLNNSSNSFGAALSVSGKQLNSGKLIIEECFFDQNIVDGGGGGINLRVNGVDSIVLRNNHFYKNFANVGAGIHLFTLSGGTSFQLDSCHFEQNHASNRGVVYHVSIPSGKEINKVSNCMFYQNTGNIFFSENVDLFFPDKTYLISNTTIRDNVGADDLNSNGLLFFNQFHLKINQSLFYENTYRRNLFVINESTSASTNTLILNSNFIDNLDDLDEGGLFSFFGNTASSSTPSQVNMINSIFYKNTPAGRLGSSLFSNVNIRNSYLDVNNCDNLFILESQDNYPSQIFCDGSNLFQVPLLFKDYPKGNFTLMSCSPLINAGNNAMVNMEGLMKDAVMHPRIQDDTVDIGIFEQVQFKYEVNEVEKVRCVGGSDGSFDISLQGQDSLALLWSKATETGTLLDSLSAGSYTFFFSDGDGCMDTFQLDLEEVDSLFVVSEVDNVSCNGLNNGRITALPEGGTYPYFYEWSTGDTDSVYSALGPGAYFLKLMDANGCMDTLSALVEEPPALSLNAESIAPACLDGEDGSAAVITFGGISPYSYEWSDGQQDSLATDLQATQYSVTVSDANACTEVLIVDVPPAVPIEVMTSSTPVSCHNGSDGVATAIGMGGQPPFQYQWSSGASDSISLSLSAGSYELTVIDANHCRDSVEVFITEPDSFFMNFSVTEPSCFGFSDGSSVALPFGATPPFDFEWSNQLTGPANINLNTGLYAISVSDANNCMYTDSIWIGEPEKIEIEVMEEDSPCFGLPGGEATPLVNGEFPPFNFMWSNGTFDSVAENLAAGDYSLTVVDANNCIDSVTFSISEFPPIEVAFEVEKPLCFEDSNGMITATATGGNIPYAYKWETGEIGPKAKELSAGTYVLWITDGNSCKDTFSVEVEEADSLLIQIFQQDVSCYTFQDGFAVAEVNYLLPPYSFNWSNGEQDSIANDLSNGLYTVTVTNGNNCENVTSVFINQPAPLQAGLSKRNISCFDSEDGHVIATPIGGTAPYFYEWAGTTVIDSILSGLAVGMYFVTVEDVNGCIKNDSITLLQPAPLSFDTVIFHASSSIAEDGSVVLDNVEGGTLPYNYSWSTGDTTTSLNMVAPGSYVLTITDANDCIYEFSFEVDVASNLAAPTVAKRDYRVFPNPIEAGGTLFIKSETINGKPPKVYFFDLLGREHRLSGKLISDKLQIELPQEFKSGVYFVGIEFDDFKMTAKVIVLDPF